MKFRQGGKSELVTFAEQLLKEPKPSADDSDEQYETKIELIQREFPYFNVGIYELSLDDLVRLDEPFKHKRVYNYDNEIQELTLVNPEFPSLREIIHHLEDIYMRKL